MNTKKAVKKYYKQILDKNKISQEFFRDALCFYEQPPERVVNFLNELPQDSCVRLNNAFSKMREKAKNYCKKNKISPRKEDEIFAQLVQGKIKGE